MTEHKIAEKLLILNQHGSGLLARLLRVKQALRSDKPGFLTEKPFDAQIKTALKSFPKFDIATEPQSPMHNKKEEIAAALEEPYYVFVDILEYQDTVNSTLVQIASTQSKFDLRVNTLVTAELLNLIQNLMSLLVLLSRIDDRRAIAALYSTASFLIRGTQEPSYPRLGNLIKDFDSPLKKVHELLSAHVSIIAPALLTVVEVFERRYLSADALRNQNIHSIHHTPNKLTQAVGLPADGQESQPIYTELLSVDQLGRWLLWGFLAFPGELENEAVANTVAKALSDGFAWKLFRSECINFHSAYDSMYSVFKDTKKLHKPKISEQLAEAVSKAPTFHQDRRAMLRHALQMLYHLFSDKPGLLGPKAAVALSAISAASDEIMWLLRHAVTPPPRSKGKLQTNLLEDEQLPELLFYFTELQGLLGQHRELLRRYHLDFLRGYDLTAVKHCAQAFGFHGREKEIVTSFVSALQALTPDSEVVDFNGHRLDWLRLQAAMATAASPTPLLQEAGQRFAVHCNLMHFHSMFIDDGLDNIIRITADASDLWFFKKKFLELFTKCLQTHSQLRFSASFVMVCDGFAHCATDFVPEERNEIGRDSQNMANHFLQRMAAKAAQTVHEMAGTRVKIEEQFRVEKAVTILVKKTGPPAQEEQQALNLQLRAHQEALGDVCWAINHLPTILVHNLMFSPREYLTELLEQSVGQGLVHLVKEGDVLLRPSVALANVQVYMAALRSIENYISVNTADVFAAAFLDQSLVVDPAKPSIATLYDGYYTGLLRDVRGNGVVLCEARRSLVSKTREEIESYTDPAELRALCELLGPFGVRQLDDDLLRIVSACFGEMKKIVVLNSDCLDIIKMSTQNAPIVLEAFKKLKEMDAFANWLTQIGCVLRFRSYLSSALAAVLQRRIPFVHDVVGSLHKQVDTRPVDMLAHSAGLPADVDPFLAQTIAEHLTQPDSDVQVFSRMMVMGVAALRHLSHQAASVFSPQAAANDNNAHTLGIAFNMLSAAMFALVSPRPEDVRLLIAQAQNEFLRVAAITMLRAGGPSDKEVPKFRDHVIGVLNEFVATSTFVTYDMFEAFFPHGLIRSAAHELYLKKTNRRGDEV